MTDKSYHDLVREAKTRIREVSAEEAMNLLANGGSVVLVDCREHNEYALGRIPGAVLIPRGLLEQNIERVAARSQKVIVYCASGNRSALAANALREMGYADVASLAGGIRAWVEAGGELDG
jgi:rhodanese-related sulfurtransferase